MKNESQRGIADISQPVSAEEGELQVRGWTSRSGGYGLLAAVWLWRLQYSANMMCYRSACQCSVSSGNIAAAVGFACCQGSLFLCRSNAFHSWFQTKLDVVRGTHVTEPALRASMQFGAPEWMCTLVDVALELLIEVDLKYAVVVLAITTPGVCAQELDIFNKQFSAVEVLMLSAEGSKIMS